MVLLDNLLRAKPPNSRNGIARAPSVVDPHIAADGPAQRLQRL
jgi:hypothetical protein